MARPFPIWDQLDAQYCFISPQDEHNRLMVELDNTVLFTTIDRFHPPPHEDFFALRLQDRYGGSPANWAPIPVQNGFLLKVPDWLSCDALEGDSEFWELCYSLTIAPWQTQFRSDPLPQNERVLISILDFPLDYWHPVYFRQAVSGMGTMVGIDQQSLRGTNKKCVDLMIECVDRRLIPRRLYVGHGSQWSECLVVLHGDRRQNEDDHPSPGPEEEQDPRWWLNRGRIMTGLPLPYIPPGRRRALQEQVSQAQPSQRGAPAAQANGGVTEERRGWSRNRAGAPSSGSYCSRINSPFTLVELVPQRGQQPATSQESQSAPLRAERTWGRSAGARHAPENEDKWAHVFSGIGRFISQKHQARAHPRVRIYDTCLRRNVEKMGQSEVGNNPVKKQLDTWFFHHPTLNQPPPYSNKFVPTLSSKHSLSFKHPTLDTGKSNLPSLSSSHYPLYSSNLSPLPNTTKSFTPMATFSEADEALIMRFAGLQTGEIPPASVQVPIHAASSTDWTLCVFAKVISDRVSMESNFIRTMQRAWGVDSCTVIRPITKNCFLVELCNEKDKAKVLSGGVWTYQGDLVATRQVGSHKDLTPEYIHEANVWVQFYNLPVNSLNEEGLSILASTVGKPASPTVDAVNGFLNGRRFVKIKVTVNLNEPLKDWVSLGHPILGDMVIHCVYEKFTRVCSYCARLGHEFSNCEDREKVSIIAQRPEYEGRFNIHSLLSPKVGSWITDAVLVPKAGERSHQPANQRPSQFTGNFGPGPHQEGNLGSPTEMLNNNSLLDCEDSSPLLRKRPRPAGPNSPAPDR